MRKLVALYIREGEVLAYTDNHLYSFPLNPMFWSRLGEQPSKVFLRLMEELKHFSSGFCLHMERKGERQREEGYEPVYIVSVPVPFFSLLFMSAMNDEIPAHYSLAMPLWGAFAFFLMRLVQTPEEKGLLVHTEQGIASFLLFEDGSPSQMFTARAEHSARVYSRLAPSFKDTGSLTLILSGEDNPVLGSVLGQRAWRRVLDLKKEDILKGLYFIAVSHLPSESGQGVKTDAERRARAIDMGDEE